MVVPKSIGIVCELFSAIIVVPTSIGVEELSVLLSVIMISTEV